MLNTGTDLSQGSAPPSRHSRDGLTVFLVAMIPYVATWNDPFFSIDDAAQIITNPHLKWTSEDLSALLHPAGAATARFKDYLPILLLTYLAEKSILGAEPWHFHLVNMVMYGFASVGFMLALRPFVRRGDALLAACLFAAHPLHVEVVAWIPARIHLIAFGLTFYAWAFYFGTKQRKLGAAITFFVANLARPQPGVGLLFWFGAWRKTGSLKEATRQAWPFMVIGGLTTLFFLSMGSYSRLAEGVSVTKGPAYAVLLLQRYLRLSIAPLNLSFYVTNHPALESVTLELAASAVVLGLLFILLVLGRRQGQARGRGSILVAALFVLPLAPVLQLIPMNIMQADRYAFMAVGAPMLVLALWIGRLRGPSATLVAIAAVGVLLALSFSRAQVWDSPVSVWADAYAKSQEPFALHHYGKALLASGRHAEGRDVYEQLVVSTPKYADAYLGLSRAYTGVGQLHDGLKVLNDGLSVTGAPVLATERDELLNFMKQHNVPVQPVMLGTESK